MNSLFILLLRILQGERLRKPTPEQERRWAGLFFLMAMYFGLVALSIRYGEHYWDTASAFTLTVVAAVIVSVGWFLIGIWGRYVAAKVSWVLGAVAWLLLFFLALTGRLM
jgi:hypothetical protein